MKTIGEVVELLGRVHWLFVLDRTRDQRPELYKLSRLTEGIQEAICVERGLVADAEHDQTVQCNFNRLAQLPPDTPIGERARLAVSNFMTWLNETSPETYDQLAETGQTKTSR